MRTLLIGVGAWLATAATAQPALPTEFPPDAAVVEDAALRDHLAGKVFRGQPASGPGWRLEYKSNGYAFLDTTAGFRDTGRWSVEQSRLCAKWERASSGCSEARMKAGIVYVKRASTGEVVALVPD